MSKRKTTLDETVQEEAKAAFRRLQLQINQLQRDYQQLRQRLQQDYIPIQTPAAFTTLLIQATQLRDELERWSNVVSGHHPVRLIDVSIRLHNKLSAIEGDLDWEKELLIRKFAPTTMAN
jgi:hypothetical protein